METLDSFLLRSHLQTQLNRHAVTTVLDIGAHEGGFLCSLIRCGYNGAVVCFEPTASSYNILKKNFSHIPKVQFCQLAVGKTDSRATIKTYQSSVFNSMLEPTQNTNQSFGGALNDASIQEVQVVTLQTFFRECQIDAKRSWLKIDVQGMEAAVLEGAGELLREIAGVLVEGAFDPLYQNAITIPEVVQLLGKCGLTLAGMYAVNRPSDGFVKEYDCLFSRS